MRQAQNEQPQWPSGPWVIEGNFDAETGVEILASNGIHIVDIEPFTENWQPDEIAKAQLIAAAPELYAALAAVESMWYEDYPGGPESPKAQGRFTSRTIEKWKAMRAALAKAEANAGIGRVER